MNKQCKRCKLNKEVTEFFKQKTGKFGVQSNCITCRKKMSKNYVKKSSAVMGTTTADEQGFIGAVIRNDLKKVKKYVANGINAHVKDDVAIRLAKIYSDDKMFKFLSKIGLKEDSHPDNDHEYYNYSSVNWENF